MFYFDGVIYLKFTGIRQTEMNLKNPVKIGFQTYMIRNLFLK